MAGNRFFIREVDQDLMARLVNIMSEPNWDELRKVETALRELKLVAKFLEKVNRERTRLSPVQVQDYQRAKETVMVYLLHYDRLSRFLLGDAGPGDWFREDLFKSADYTDWKIAYGKASVLFAEYARTKGQPFFRHRPPKKAEAANNTYAGNL